MYFNTKFNFSFLNLKLSVNICQFFCWQKKSNFGQLMENVKKETEHITMKGLLYKVKQSYCFTYTTESIIDADRWVSVFIHMQFLSEGQVCPTLLQM